jgi:FMN phosphatase YigB (HAD superfamily)
MNTNSIYIFDLDHTLFNARDFKKDLSILLSGKPDMISEDIWNYFNASNKKTLDFISKNSKKYLFKNVLENLKKIKEEKILLTFGDIDFQKIKIKSLELDKVFDKIILVDENKIIFLEDFYKKNLDKKIFFINDNYNKRFNENNEINDKIPGIEVFEIDNYKKDSLKTIDNFFKKY